MEISKKLSREIIALLSITFLTVIYLIQTYADPTNTVVTINNTAPTFSVDPVETVASYIDAPTNVGSSVTFQATGTDINSDNYYLAICKTNAITVNNSGAPVCDGGNWCTSTSTASASQTSCSYTTLIGDAEVNAWYAFVCDATGAQMCSSSSQGTGNSGSPFEVNHRPSFTAMTDGASNPGGSITFTATASDVDTQGNTSYSPDQVKLFVCRNAGATSAGCTGTTLCTASLTDSNPSCTWNTVDSVIQDGNYSYYPYIYDNHDFAASANPLAGVDFTINNVAPVVSNVSINGGNAINLTENTSTTIEVKGRVNDNNSCQDVTTANVIADVYRSGIGRTNCHTAPNANENYCYSLISCTLDSGTCTGGTDAQAGYTCNVAIWFNADPTDTSTLFDGENWLTTLNATDDGSNFAYSEVASGVEMNSLVAINITSTINYGSLGLGQDTGSTNQTAQVDATGNVGIDTDISGTDMTYLTNTIPVANQKYSLSTFTYSSGGIGLSTTPTFAALDVSKTLSHSSPANKNVYWGILIPSNIAAGTYNGTNTLSAIKSPAANW